MKKLNKFDKSLLALSIIFMFLTLIAMSLTICGFKSEWYLYAADSVLSILGTLITVRVIQKHKTPVLSGNNDDMVNWVQSLDKVALNKLKELINTL